MSEPLVTVFIGLRVDKVNKDDAPLHITLTFVEDTTQAEREALWAKYSALVEPALPVEFTQYGETMVGPDEDMRALDVMPKDFDLEFELDEFYVQTVRRRRNKFPRLNYHVTLNTEKKVRSAKELGNKFFASTLYMREVSDEKRVLAQTSKIHEIPSFVALDRVSLRIQPASVSKAPASVSKAPASVSKAKSWGPKSKSKTPKGPRKAKPIKEKTASASARQSVVVGSRRARRPPQRFKPKH